MALDLVNDNEVQSIFVNEEGRTNDESSSSNSEFNRIDVRVSHFSVYLFIVNYHIHRLWFRVYVLDTSNTDIIYYICYVIHTVAISISIVQVAWSRIEAIEIEEIHG